jgi:hypothetical protein
MSGLILLTVGLACLALIIGATAYFGLKAWRLARRGLRMGRTAAPLATQLGAQSAALAAQADHLAANAERIGANFQRLQASARRLQVLAEAWSAGVAPYRRLRDYLGR